jgi:uracil phosphoribosyltransferase
MKAQADLNPNLRVLDHPLAFALLSRLRQSETPPNEFRPAMQKLAMFLLLEAARSWEIKTREMVSPLAPFPGQEMVRAVALIPILRAGLGLQEGMMQLLPEASTGHIGLYRDPETVRPVKYYSRLPAAPAEMEVLVLDPMLATGHSAAKPFRSSRARARNVCNSFARSPVHLGSRRCNTPTPMCRSSLRRSTRS